MDARTTRRSFVTVLAGGAIVRESGMDHAARARTRLHLDSPGTPLAITDVTVIDATGAAPLPHFTVTIAGDRIASIQPAPAASVPKGARVVDGRDRFLIPGLWDAHVHTFVFPWQPEVYFPLLIANGVTGIRDMGGTLPIDAIDAIRDVIAAGEKIGPRIVAGTMVDGPVPVWPFALRAGTAAAGRQAVAAIAESRADFVKVYTLLPREAYLAIAEAANARDLPFSGHVPIAITAAEAAAAGQRTVEHYSDSLLPYCSTHEDEVLSELRAAAAGPDPVQTYAATFFAALPRILESIDTAKIARLASQFAAPQTRFTPTLIIGRNAAAAGDPARRTDPRLRLLPPEVVSSWIPPDDVAIAPAVDPGIAARSLETGAAITRAMHDAGVPLLAGTDLGLPFVYPGSSLHEELALLVDAGLTPLVALQTATRNPAQAAGLGDDLGTVAVGKLADLVLLAADPLADITNTTRIAAVVTNGRLLERPELERLLPEAAPQVTPRARPIP